MSVDPRLDAEHEPLRPLPRPVARLLRRCRDRPDDRRARRHLGPAAARRGQGRLRVLRRRGPGPRPRAGRRGRLGGDRHPAQHVEPDLPDRDRSGTPPRPGRPLVRVVRLGARGGAHPHARRVRRRRPGRRRADAAVQRRLPDRPDRAPVRHRLGVRRVGHHPARPDRRPGRLHDPVHRPHRLHPRLVHAAGRDLAAAPRRRPRAGPRLPRRPHARVRGRHRRAAGRRRRDPRGGARRSTRSCSRSARSGSGPATPTTRSTGASQEATVWDDFVGFLQDHDLADAGFDTDAAWTDDYLPVD